MASPLVQVNVSGQKHQPKVVQLYEQLFNSESLPPGFWVELFILPVAEQPLFEIVAARPADQLVNSPTNMHTLVAAAVSNARSSDIFVSTNALRMLQVVLAALFQHRLSSADLIKAIAGLDRIDGLFDDLTDAVFTQIDNRQPAAVQFLLKTAAGAYGTSLTPYFNSKNFFTPLVRLVGAEPATSPLALQAFELIAVLANMHKFGDHVDVYLERIADFVDEEVMAKLLAAAQPVLAANAAAFTVSEPSSWLSWFKRDSSQSLRPPSTDGPEEIPPRSIVVLLALYEFAAHNEMFACLTASTPAVFAPLLDLMSELANQKSTLASVQPTSRSPVYLRLSLLVLRKLVESPRGLQTLCSVENKTVFHLTQTKHPLQLEQVPYTPLAGVMDVVQIVLRANLRQPLDTSLYVLCLTILLQTLVGLRTSRLQFYYHWPQLGLTILILLRALDKMDKCEPVASLVIELATAILSQRDLFDPEDYSALFYQIVPDRELIARVVQKQGLTTGSAKALEAMAAHYELLTGQGGFSDTQIADVVRQGPVRAIAPDKFSEAAEQAFLKRAVRTAFADVTFTSADSSAASSNHTRSVSPR